MDTLIADAKPGEEATRAVNDDAQVIRGFKPAPYREAYLARLAEYQRLLEHGPTAEQRSAPPLAPPREAPAPTPDLGATESAGRLRQGGAYLGNEAGQRATQLSDGSIFVIGAGIERDDADDPLRLADQLRKRDFAQAHASIDPSPKWWDTARRGWRRLPHAPECAHGRRGLHSLTPLPDAKVLGGRRAVPRAPVRQ